MKSERLGLMMIASSLVVIAVIVALFVDYQRTERLSQIRVQGVALARLLSSMPYEQLVPRPGRQGPLQIVKSTQANRDFGYASVVDARGQALAQVTAPGIIPPAQPLNTEPSAWFGERTVSASENGPVFREFHAPVLADGELAAYLKVGYSEPRFALGTQKPTFFALLALPIFLLAPLFYYLIRREINPLREVSNNIQKILQENRVQNVELSASGEIGEFIRYFNRFVKATKERIADLENEHTNVVTSSKVLSYQKAKVESVLQSLPEAVIIMDESAKATFASSKLGSMLGVEAEKIVGLAPREWCEMPDLLAFLSSYHGNTIRKNESGSITVSPQHMHDKRLAVSAYPLFSPRDNANVYGTLVVLHDVTAQTLSKQAQKDFLAHLAHELKTPLHVIGMYGESLLTDENHSKDFQIEAGNVINDEVERVSTLIKNMLSMAKIEMGSISVERQRTKLRDLLQDTFDTVMRSAECGELEFKLELPSDMSSINVDKELLRTAVNNLLTNAIKYNRPGGVVALYAEESDEQIKIAVRDTGIGIDLEDQAHIFDKFFRSENQTVRKMSGHGLGLSLTKQIVETHHGELKVESTPDEGSEFSIIFQKTPILLKEAV